MKYAIWSCFKKEKEKEKKKKEARSLFYPYVSYFSNHVFQRSLSSYLVHKVSGGLAFFMNVKSKIVRMIVLLSGKR